jgi:5-formyltetrahydrofolate cyclo-ligase
VRHNFKSIEQTQADKHQLRKRCLRYRCEQPDKQVYSRQICTWLTKMPEYQTARIVATYVSLSQEAQTFELINRAWSDDKEVVVPCCVSNELHMFHLKAMTDLVPCTLNILEPRQDLRQREERWLDVSQIDLFIVPGVAFDRSGGRLGHGKGYYDRLLAKAQPGTPKIAFAFERQVVDQVPMTTDDVLVDYVITERQVYRCKRK